jgi:tetratricopeptide (TPR) repeat protein
MIEAPSLEIDFPLVTDCEIAVINLESARRQSWSRFWQDPRRPGIAEYIVEQEQFTAQYVGDLGALERLDALVDQLDRVGADEVRTALIHAQVASMGHRFAEGREYLAQAEAHGAPQADVNRLTLSIDQACGTNLESVLEARRKMAAESERLEDLVPLGGLLADLREFEEADRVYRQALSSYQDVSPFAVAWVCFQLGALWGELVPEPQPERAARWYQKAIEYLPCYVKARVHLSETYLQLGRVADAEALLVPAVSSGDPEVNWRLADVLAAMEKPEEAESQMQAARSGFETLLDKYLLAFADHGAEFYSGCGNNSRRTFELAMVNLANRPTLRAFEQAYETAIEADETQAASELLTSARKRWGRTDGFGLSPLAAAIHADSQKEKQHDS